MFPRFCCRGHRLADLDLAVLLVIGPVMNFRLGHCCDHETICCVRYVVTCFFRLLAHQMPMRKPTDRPCFLRLSPLPLVLPARLDRCQNLSRSRIVMAFSCHPMRCVRQAFGEMPLRLVAVRETLSAWVPEMLRSRIQMRGQTIPRCSHRVLHPLLLWLHRSSYRRAELVHCCQTSANWRLVFRPLTQAKAIRLVASLAFRYLNCQIQAEFEEGF